MITKDAVRTLSVKGAYSEFVAGRLDPKTRQAFFAGAMFMFIKFSLIADSPDDVAVDTEHLNAIAVEFTAFAQEQTRA